LGNRTVKNLFYALAISLLFINTFSTGDDAVRFDRARGHFKNGVQFFNNLQYLAAVEFFRRAVAEYPDYSTAREYLARSYKLAGFIDEALKEWETLSDLNKNNLAINSKIETIRFRQISGNHALSPGQYVLSNEYVSSIMKMYKFKGPTDIAVDREKNVYITSFSSGKLLKFDQNGNGIASLSPFVDSRLYGIDYYNDMLAVSDFKKDQVYILNTACKIIKTFGSHGSEEGQFRGPEGVCFDRSGYIYVVDNGNHRVQKFDEDGKFILRFGEQGEYEGNLNNPTDIAVSGNSVYVTDTGNKRIASFDDSGNFIKNITLKRLEKPRGINLFNNNLLVSDESAGLLMHGIEDGRSEWFNIWDDGKRKFSRLFSTSVDRDGFLYCLDYSQERAFVFSPLQMRYTNFDVEITSIDTKKYPVVAIYTAVRGRSGAPVYGLTKDSFKVFEDSAFIPGTYVDYLKDLHPSSSMVLCIDRSGPMSAFNGELPWVSEFILKKMRKNDSIKVVNFNSDSWNGSNFDWSRRRTLAAVRKKSYDSGKNIGAALYHSITDLLPKTNRRGVIFLTDGTVTSDSFQKYSARNIIEYARSHFVPIYIVTFKEKDPELENIASSTGGAIYRASEADSLRNIYDNIRKSEEYRYVLVYYTFKLPSFKGWWSDLKIEVNHKGQYGSEWGGYFVPQRN
jgi:DNA-binding beta-propeller fold protein YncE